MSQGDQLPSFSSCTQKKNIVITQTINKREREREREFLMSMIIIIFVSFLILSSVEAKYNVIHIVADDLRPELG